MEKKLELIKYIDVNKLQSIQDRFSQLLDMGISISDAEGSVITQHSSMCDFCKFTRVSPEGSKRCRDCDRVGAELAMKEGHAVSYTCHAGLVDFSAPIIIGDTFVGSFSGGQIRTGEPDVERVLKTAEDIGINPDMYLALARKTPVVTQEKLQDAMDFVYEVANTISEMAYKQFLLENQKAEVEYAAQLKADFLANMSHEIRTPMNGVIGMAELALREDLPEEARNYINQIRASGKTLLAIINDILDFSKIESGKMEIISEAYEPLSIVNDVSNVIITRIGEKPIDLSLDVNPMLPSKLYGDNIRITQILMNLANNAVKFTKAGRVLVGIDFEWIDEETILLKGRIQDTGAGITEENQKKLFQSFQQIDSKRNRGVEGTGLGLAIVKRLLEAMNGSIKVESVYGEGSTFSFTVPQKVVEKHPLTQLVNKDVKVKGFLNNAFIEMQLERDVKRLGGDYVTITEQEIQANNGEILEQTDYLFVDDSLTNQQIEALAQKHKKLIVVNVIDYKEHKIFRQDNVHTIKKPVFILALVNIFNSVYSGTGNYGAAQDDYMFTAPSAKVLIVDDNAVNLAVATGLLKPLHMQIDTAISGKDALSKVAFTKYDLIFMDHMMPEMDGIETTHKIRQLHPEYCEIPILALTANVVSGAREMFIKEGLNDIVAKPIEMKAIVLKLRTWLPQEKQIRFNENKGEERKEMHTLERLKAIGLDTDYAMELLMDEELYLEVLEEYYRVIDEKAEVIQKHYDNADWQNYTIEVHALKSASRQVGAIELADLAYEMELAGKALNADLIHEKNHIVIQMYLELKEKLAGIFDKDEAEEDAIAKPMITVDKLFLLLGKIETALDDLNMDSMEDAIKEMKSYSYAPKLFVKVNELMDAALDFDVDTCEAVIGDIKSSLN